MSLVVFLRTVDGEKPSMGYIYEGMDRVKEAIRSFFTGNRDRYGPIWDVIDRHWYNLLHRPIHAAAYFLNPAYQFSPHFKADDEILGTDTSPIVLENVDPHAKWNTEIVDLVFNDEDVEWVDQVDREAEAVAMAVEKARAQGDRVQDPEARSDGSEFDDENYVGEDEDDDGDDDKDDVQPQTQGERMALQSSMTYLRHTRRRT